MSSTWDPISGSLDIVPLAQLYRNDAINPLELINAIFDRIRQRGDDHVWITLVDLAVLLTHSRQLQAIRQQGPDCLQGFLL